MPALQDVFKAQGVDQEVTRVAAFRSRREDKIRMPNCSNCIEALMILLGTDRRNIMPKHFSLIAEFLRSEVCLVSINYKLNNSFFESEYFGLWEALTGIEYSRITDSNHQYKILLVETDSHQKICNALSAHTTLEYLLTVTRIEGKLHLYIGKRLDEEFISIDKLIAINANTENIKDIDSIKRISSILHHRVIKKLASDDILTPCSDEELVVNLENKFSEKHFNRAFSGLNPLRDYLIYQYYDFLGNRTLGGFNGQTDINNDTVLTGASAVWCRELPFDWGFEGLLRSLLLNNEVSNLSGGGELLEHELAKIQHYLLYKGIPKNIISFTLHNDLFWPVFCKDKNEAKAFASIGFNSVKNNDDNYSDDILFTKKIVRILIAMDSLAKTFKYKHIVIIQPTIHDYPNQLDLFQMLQASSETKIDITRSAKYHERANNRVNMILARLKSIKLNSLIIEDGRQLFKDKDEMMFYDHVHLTRKGVQKVCSWLVERHF